MKYQETLNQTLSSGRKVNLDCSCSIVGSELIDFNVFIKDGTFMKECELEECNNIAHKWAKEIVYGQTA